MRRLIVRVVCLTALFIGWHVDSPIAQAQATDSCRDVNLALVIDASAQSDGLSTRVGAARQVLPRLLVDNTMRCPDNSYQLGIYYYGTQTDDFEVALPFEALPAVSLQATDIGEALNAQLSSDLFQSAYLTDNLSVSATLRAGHLERIASDVSVNSATLELLIISSGRESAQGTGTIDELIEPALPEANATVLEVADERSLGITGATLATNLTTSVDTELDRILGLGDFSSTVCGRFTLASYRDRLALRFSGGNLRDFTIQAADETILSGGATPLSNVTVVRGSDDRYWLVMHQPPAGQWTITLDDDAENTVCRYRQYTIGLEDANTAVQVAGDDGLPVYGEAPFYPTIDPANPNALPLINTRLIVALNYSNGVAVANDGGSVTGSIVRDGEEVQADLGFTYDSARGGWVSETPPPVSQAGNYTVQLTGRSESGAPLFQSAPRAYEVPDVQAIRFVLVPNETAQDTPQDLNCLGDNDQTVICAGEEAVAVDVRIEAITAQEDDPLVPLAQAFAMIDPLPLELVLTANNNILSVVDFEETDATPGLLRAVPDLSPDAGLANDGDPVAFGLSVRLKDGAQVAETYRVFDQASDETTPQYWVRNNSETKDRITPRIVLNEEDAASTFVYDLYGSFPANCEPLYSQTPPMPVEIQLQDEQSNAVPIQTALDDGADITTFVDASLSNNASGEAVDVVFDIEDNRLTTDLSAVIQQAGGSFGAYTLTLQYSEARVNEEQFLWQLPDYSAPDALITEANGDIIVPVVIAASSPLNRPESCQAGGVLGIILIAWAALHTLLVMLFRMDHVLVIRSRDNLFMTDFDVRPMAGLSLFGSGTRYFKDPKLRDQGVGRIKVRRLNSLSRRSAISIEAFDPQGNSLRLEPRVELGTRDGGLIPGLVFDYLRSRNDLDTPPPSPTPSGSGGGSGSGGRTLRRAQSPASRFADGDTDLPATPPDDDDTPRRRRGRGRSTRPSSRFDQAQHSAPQRAVPDPDPLPQRDTAAPPTNPPKPVEIAPDFDDDDDDF